MFLVWVVSRSGVESWGCCLVRTFLSQTKNYLVKQRWLSLWVGTDFALLDENYMGGWVDLWSIGHFLSSTKLYRPLMDLFHVHFIGTRGSFLQFWQGVNRQSQIWVLLWGVVLAVSSYILPCEGTEGDCTSCCESGTSSRNRYWKYSNICVAVWTWKLLTAGAGQSTLVFQWLRR